LAIGTSGTTSGTGRITTVDVQSGATISSARILRLETGSLLLNGGNVTSTTSASGNDGFSIGNTQNFNSAENPAAIVTINSGSLTAVSTNAATPRDGIRIANSNAQNGGIIHLNGGTIITSNINSLAGTSGNARGVINFNGGTLQVASSASAGQRAIFLNGFSNITNKQALIQAGGAKIDTNGFTDVVITSPLNSGNLTDGGLTLNETALTAGRLTLNGTNTYNGATYAQRGTIALGTGGGISSSSRIRIADVGGFDSSAQTSFTLTNTTQFDLTATSGLFNAGSSALVYNGSLVLNFLSGSPAASYNLFDFGSRSGSFTNVTLMGNGFSGTFTDLTAFTSNNYNLSFDYSTGILSLAVIPEPAETAVILLLGIITIVAIRRRSAARA
jgi:autotransporter-associated beta strand protein